MGGKLRTGMAWFEPQEYARILEIMNYPSDMSRDYDRWREVAENSARSGKRAGRFIVRVVVHPEEFVEWCASKAVQPIVVPSTVSFTSGLRAMVPRHSFAPSASSADCSAFAGRSCPASRWSAFRRRPFRDRGRLDFSI